MQLTSVLVLLASFGLCFQGSDALARSKLDQYTSDDCDGNWGDGKAYRSSSNVDIKAGTCVDINASTNSIWLGRGTGLVWRRKMTAYSETGCPANKRIDFINEKDGYYKNRNGKVVPKGNCFPIDFLYVGAQGVDQTYQGRLMSVKFDSY
ncbi:uncharacterized protein Aud_006910 [Aspergillus udagawae]|uniref:Secreted protein n=1 Tax=Aspergillus udagawae TaxID=91492 RepID=A0A8E0V1H7_9EURO|nr:uncharacterized protein Aud_006910 [Aspergillus udagawae]GIC90476.1 hypothetical protein Aud_006910 [Aspergillus udagawae]